MYVCAPYVFKIKITRMPFMKYKIITMREDVYKRQELESLPRGNALQCNSKCEILAPML